MVKIAHIADCHLRTRQYGSTQRGEDFTEGLLSALEAAHKEECRYVIIAGDLLDTMNPGSAMCLDVLDRINAFAIHHDMTLLTVSGNHDRAMPPWESRFDELVDDGSMDGAVYGFCNINNRTFDASDDPDNDDGTVVRIHGVPYMPNNEMRALLPSLPEADILVWHGALADFAGFPVESALTVAEFAETGKWRILAMGDLHIHSMIECKGMVAAYPGSTEMCSSAEEPEKSFYVYTIDKDSVKVDSIPFKTREKQFLNVTDEASMAEAVTSMHKGAVVYVKYVDSVENAAERLCRAAEATGAFLVSQSVAAGGADVIVGRCSEMETPAEYLHRNIASYTDPDRAQRIEGLCAAMLHRGEEWTSELEDYCTNALARVGASQETISQ